MIFGANMTSLNFALSRTVARDWQPGDEVVVTKLDHDANISPWLELAEDRGIVVHLCELDAECRLDLDHLRSLLTDRTRVVAFPWASNAVGTVTPVDEIAALAHEAGALAWVDAVHYAPHGPIDLTKTDVDVLLCSPYKFFGPHLGVAVARRELLERWRPYKVRPAPDLPLGHRFETGTLPHELLCGFVAAVEYVSSVQLEVHPRARDRARAAVPGRVAGRLDAARPADDGGSRDDVRDHACGRVAVRGRDPARRRAASRSGTATTTRSR